MPHHTHVPASAPCQPAASSSPAVICHVCAFADTVRAVTGGYLVAILLVFLGGMVGLKLPGLFSGGPLAMAVHLVAAGLAAANLLVRGHSTCRRRNGTADHMHVCCLRSSRIAASSCIKNACALVHAPSAPQLDFDWIQKASYQRLPQFMEWYGAQSLMLTLVWMYTEVLKLLWMFAGRRDE